MSGAVIGVGIARGNDLRKRADTTGSCLRGFDLRLRCRQHRFAAVAQPDNPAAVGASPAPVVSGIPAVWASFRGPDLDGVYRQGEILTKWPEKGLPLVWKQPIGLGYSLNQASNLPWGMSASPLIVDDKVVVQPGGNHGNSVVAYNKHTGEAIWKSLDDTQAYTSPMLVTLAGRRQILTVTKTRAVGLDAESGRLA